MLTCKSHQNFMTHMNLTKPVSLQDFHLLSYFYSIWLRAICKMQHHAKKKKNQQKKTRTTQTKIIIVFLISYTNCCALHRSEMKVSIRPRNTKASLFYLNTWINTDVRKRWSFLTLHTSYDIKRKTDITKQQREDQATGCVWRAQPHGFNPNPLDLHGC